MAAQYRSAVPVYGTNIVIGIYYGGRSGQVYDLNPSGATFSSPPVLSVSYEGYAPHEFPEEWLGIYVYDETGRAWHWVGGIVDAVNDTVTAALPHLSLYTVSAELPDDEVAPVVAISSPVPADTVTGLVSVIADATDDTGVSSVTFFLDTAQVGEDADSSDGWTYEIDTAPYVDGNHVIMAMAEDPSGNRGTATVAVVVSGGSPPPTVSIDAPMAGTTVCGQVEVAGQCWDDEAIVAVDLLLDGDFIGNAALAGSDWVFSWDMSQCAVGAHTISATARDAVGNSATDSVAVGVSPARLTGGGWILRDGQKCHFGFNADFKPGKGCFGSLQYVDHATGLNVKSTAITSLSISRASASFGGTCIVNGTEEATFVVDVQDGEPAGDSFSVSLSTGHAASGELAGGNIRVRE